MRHKIVHTAFLALHYAIALLADSSTVRLEPSRISLGRFLANNPPTAELLLVNTGETPLANVRVRTSCDCLSAVSDSDSVQSGGQMRISLSIAPENITGAFSHGIFVEAGENLLRASVVGESVPLFTVRPQNAFYLGDIVCGSPFHVEFRLAASEHAVLGTPSTTHPVETKIIKTSPVSFHIVLCGATPTNQGRFRFSVSIPVASPEGWKPVELSVFGNAVAPLVDALPEEMFEKQKVAN